MFNRRAPRWNQKWRKPLRDALDYLRDEFASLFEQEGAKYFDNVWEVRNKYIEVILDRNEMNVKNSNRKTLDLIYLMKIKLKLWNYWKFNVSHFSCIQAAVGFL